jgi:hypothetical protein
MADKTEAAIPSSCDQPLKKKMPLLGWVVNGERRPAGRQGELVPHGHPLNNSSLHGGALFKSFSIEIQAENHIVPTSSSILGNSAEVGNTPSPIGGRLVGCNTTDDKFLQDAHCNLSTETVDAVYTNALEIKHADTRRKWEENASAGLRTPTKTYDTLATTQPVYFDMNDVDFHQ